jgi:hypothetical protein
MLLYDLHMALQLGFQLGDARVTPGKLPRVGTYYIGLWYPSRCNARLEAKL